MVTVILPHYNQSHLIHRALSSVLRQLGDPDELIVCDDHSSEEHWRTLQNVWEAAKRLHPNRVPRMTLLRNAERRGVSASRNRAIKKAANPWLKFLDADDWLIDFLLISFRYIDIPDVLHVLIGGQIKIVNGIMQGIQMSSPYAIDTIREQNPMLPSMVFVRTETVKEVGGFDERLEFEEDWDLWQSIYDVHGPRSFFFLPMPFCYYWIDERERQQKTRVLKLDGMDVREYIRNKHRPVEGEPS